MTMAEAFGIVSGVVAVLQITNTVLSVCYDYNDAVQNAQGELPRVQKEMEDLRTVLQALEPIAKRAQSSNQAQLRKLDLLCNPQGPLETCRKEIERLEEKLKSPAWMKNFGPKRTALAQSLRWPLKEAETNKSLEIISRMKQTLQLALHADHTLLALKIEELCSSTNSITLGTQKDLHSTRDVILQTQKNIQDNVRFVHDAVSQTREDVQETAKLATESHRDFQREKIYRWLSGPDPSTNYLRARRSRQDNTGLWFFHGPFNDWTKKAQLMWLHGKPGCGKTVLSSTIIAQIYETCIFDEVAVAYFYFDFNDIEKQKSENMIRSIVKQLYTSSVKNFKVESLFSSCHNGERQSSSDDLIQVLKSLMKGFRKTYVILDALDECSDIDQLLTNIEEIQGWQLTGLHMLLTSRRHKDIEDALKPLINLKNRICIQSAAVDADIEIYIRHRLQTDKKLRRWQNHTLAQKEINNALKSKADGMFRWAVCQLDALQNCFNLTSLRKALESLPKTLDETYARILFNIRNDHSEYAIKILQWLAYSMRPLELGELAEIVAINPHGDSRFDRDARFPEPRDILTICQGLVVEEKRDEDGDEYDDDEDDDADQDEDDNGDRNADNDADRTVDDDEKWDENNETRDENHHEHQDEDRSENRNVGLVNTSDDSEKYGKNDNNGDNIEGISKRSEEKSKNANTDENTDQIGDDGSQKTESENLNEVDGSSDSEDIPYIKYYFKNRNIIRLAHFSVKEYLQSERIRDKTASRYAEEASKYAIREISAHESIAAHCLAYLLQFEQDGKVYRSDWNNRSGKFIKGYHLSNYAATQLIEHVNALGQDLGSIKELSLTLFFTYKKAFKKFNGLNDIRSKMTPLHTATALRAIEFVRLSLQNGADVNGRNGDNETALYIASLGGHVKIVQLLLNEGANVNHQGGFFHNALQAASCRKNVEIVQILLNKGADVNEQGGMFQTALQAASYGGNVEIVQILLKKGADVNVQGGKYHTALQAASFAGNVEIVQLLLKKGADVNVQDGKYHTALQAASFQDHIEIVQLLLKNGADVNAQVGYYHTALQAASCRGNVEIVQLLLKKGADVNVQGGHYHTALQAASCRENVEIVQILIDKGADVNISGGRLHTALQDASFGGNVEIVQLLLKKRADVNVQGGHYHTALQAASCTGNVEIVQLLLKNGADVNASGGNFCTALHAAALHGFEEIAKILLNEQADVNILGKFPYYVDRDVHGTALHAASAAAEAACVKILLAHGADVDAVGTLDDKEMTALELALELALQRANTFWWSGHRPSDEKYEVIQLLRSAQDSQRNVEQSHVS